MSQVPQIDGGLKGGGAAVRGRRADFDHVNQAALAAMPSLLARWLPGGRVAGHEYVALNPRRVDRHRGSFRINMKTGRWADFAATGASGRDPISLAACLADLSQGEAADALAHMLGLHQ